MSESGLLAPKQQDRNDFYLQIGKRRRTCGNVDESEQSHPGVTVHRPLLRLTVWLTAVVHEACLVPLRPGINDPILKHKVIQQEMKLNLITV